MLGISKLFDKKHHMEGKFIKEIIQKHGMSEAEIARKMGLSPQNLNSKLKGKDIGLGFIKKIALSSKIPLMEFIPEIASEINLNDAGGEYGTVKLRDLQAELDEAKQIIYDLNMEILRLKMKK